MTSGMPVRRHQELHTGIGQTVGPGFGGDALIGALRLRLNTAELLVEVELTEQEGERSAHVVALLELHFLGLVFVRCVKPQELAVAHEQLALRLIVVPAHASRLAQQQRAALRPTRPPRRRIVLMKKDLQRLGLVVPSLDALQKRIQPGIGRARRHTQQARH